MIWVACHELLHRHHSVKTTSGRRRAPRVQARQSLRSPVVRVLKQLSRKVPARLVPPRRQRPDQVRQNPQRSVRPSKQQENSCQSYWRDLSKKRKYLNMNINWGRLWEAWTWDHNAPFVFIAGRNYKTFYLEFYITKTIQNRSLNTLDGFNPC